jgi:hypothetical protein
MREIASNTTLPLDISLLLHYKIGSNQDLSKGPSGKKENNILMVP